MSDDDRDLLVEVLSEMGAREDPVFVFAFREELSSRGIDVDRARLLTGGGYRLLASASFGELVLGCINTPIFATKY